MKRSILAGVLALVSGTTGLMAQKPKSQKEVDAINASVCIFKTRLELRQPSFQLYSRSLTDSAFCFLFFIGRFIVARVENDPPGNQSTYNGTKKA